MSTCLQILSPFTSQVAPLSTLRLSHWWYSALAVAGIVKCMYVTGGREQAELGKNECLSSISVADVKNCWKKMSHFEPLVGITTAFMWLVADFGGGLKCFGF